MMIMAVPSRIPYPFTAGFGPAWAAVESMSRVLAAELGPVVFELFVCILPVLLKRKGRIVENHANVTKSYRCEGVFM